MRTILILTIIFFFGINSFAQKMTGFGGEISALSIKPNVRMWISKTTGFEVFAGPSSELGNFKPDDLEVGFKILNTIRYKRNYRYKKNDRFYFGVVGKWKWLNVYDETNKINLPIPGILIGKEWYGKKKHRKGFAIELGYQYGEKEYKVFSPEYHHFIGNDKFIELPLILNLRYTFYQKKQ